MGWRGLLLVAILLVGCMLLFVVGSTFAVVSVMTMEGTLGFTLFGLVCASLGVAMCAAAIGIFVSRRRWSRRPQPGPPSASSS